MQTGVVGQGSEKPSTSRQATALLAPRAVYVCRRDQASVSERNPLMPTSFRFKFLMNPTTSNQHLKMGRNAVLRSEQVAINSRLCIGRNCLTITSLPSSKLVSQSFFPVRDRTLKKTAAKPSEGREAIPVQTGVVGQGSEPKKGQK